MDMALVPPADGSKGGQQAVDQLPAARFGITFGIEAGAHAQAVAKGDEAVGDVVDVAAGGDRADRGGKGDLLANDRAQPGILLEVDGVVARIGRRARPEAQQHGDARRAQAGGHQHAEQGAQPLAPGRMGRDRLGEALAALLGDQPRGKGEQLVAVAEVVLDDAGGEAGLARDLAQRGALDAVAADDAPGRLGDLLAAQIVIDQLGYGSSLRFVLYYVCNVKIQSRS